MADDDQTHATIVRRISETTDMVTVALDALLPRATGSEGRLLEAMRYAVLGPGRRLRPHLALETARLFTVDQRSVLRAACAIECVHAYSQIHDDLPALDDGLVRGGRPTVHDAYDEATAILAGDALQAAAFEILAHGDTHTDPALRCELVARLAVATGAQGMVGGQMLNLLSEGADLHAVARVQQMKTGALIGFAVEAPLILGGASEAERHALLDFAQAFGLAYQILGDLNDKGHDRRPGPGDGSCKADFVTLLGRPAAEERVDLLSQQCRTHLDVFGSRGAYLRASVDFVLDLGLRVPE